VSRQSAIQHALQHLDSGDFAKVLGRRVALATESEEASQAPLLHAYLTDDIAPALTDMGFVCTTWPNPTGRDLPFLVADRIEDSSLPTVLLYGHGDVVRGQAASWREGLDPWTLVHDAGRWFGRGTADNKGQHSIVFAALQSVIDARKGSLGYNVRILFEMGEEAGSPGLLEFCRAQRACLSADLLIASDGPRLAAERPTLFMGSRGAVNFELRVTSRERAYHSGNWGGLLENPAIVLTHALASLVDARGRIVIDALRPPAMPDTVDRAVRDLEVGTGAEDPVIDATWGEPGLNPAQQVFGWNTLEILTLDAGQPAKPVNAIPAKASAWCQLRFVVGTDWQHLEQHVRAHLDAAGFPMVQITIGAQAGATRLDPQDPWVQWAAQSVSATTGQAPVLLPNLGGSLPNDVFADELGLPTLWVPHSYPACAQHAPNEHLLESVTREGLAMMAGLFWDLGDAAEGLRDGAAQRRRAA
jgi:acetylornithine deacetylase/succinyl-diaminopimelate desuccinylase-like protein